jgi:hypothetical protein
MHKRLRAVMLSPEGLVSFGRKHTAKRGQCPELEAGKTREWIWTLKQSLESYEI